MTDPVPVMPCKQCQKRLGCTVRDCGDQDCKCRQVCEQCAASIARVVRSAWGDADLKQEPLV